MNPLHYELSHLETLEAEAIHIFREVAAEFERPVLLFCGGKDSIVLLRLAEKAFRPGRFPFPIMHVDTGHNFPEVIEFRDRLVERARRAADRRQRPGVDRRGPRGRGDRAARVAQPAADDDAARRDRRARVRRGVRRRAPRRGARPREGAGVLVPRRLRPVGPQAPAPRAVGALQRRASARASTCACSRSRTGPSSTSGSTSPTSSLELPSIYFAHTRQVFERDGMLYALQPVRRADRGRGAVRGVGPLPHRRRHDLHRRGPLSAATLQEVVAEIAATRDHRARRDPRRRPRDRGGDGGPQARGLLLAAGTRPMSTGAQPTATPCDAVPASCCGSRPPGSVDDGKSTLIGRLLHDSKAILEDQLEHVAGDLRAPRRRLS